MNANKLLAICRELLHLTLPVMHKSDRWQCPNCLAFGGSDEEIPHFRGCYVVRAMRAIKTLQAE